MRRDKAGLGENSSTGGRGERGRGSQGSRGIEPHEWEEQSLRQNMEVVGVARVKLAVFVQKLPGESTRRQLVSEDGARERAHLLIGHSEAWSGANPRGWIEG